MALHPWQRRGVYATLTVLTISGIAWLLAHGLVPDGDLTALHYKRWAIRLHAAAVPLSLLVIGSVLSDHIRLAWQLRKNRWSGVAMATTLGLLVSTGYAVGYAPDGTLRQWSAWAHWAAGLVLPLALGLHVVLGRRRAFRRELFPPPESSRTTARNCSD